MRVSTSLAIPACCRGVSSTRKSARRRRGSRPGLQPSECRLRDFFLTTADLRDVVQQVCPLTTPPGARDHEASMMLPELPVYKTCYRSARAIGSHSVHRAHVRTQRPCEHQDCLPVCTSRLPVGTQQLNTKPTGNRCHGNMCFRQEVFGSVSLAVDLPHHKRLYKPSVRVATARLHRRLRLRWRLGALAGIDHAMARVVTVILQAVAERR